ncbi:unnamed protein product, partial [Nesidiocoris tenuis]
MTHRSSINGIDVTFEPSHWPPLTTRGIPRSARGRPVNRLTAHARPVRLLASQGGPTAASPALLPSDRRPLWVPRIFARPTSGSDFRKFLSRTPPRTEPLIRFWWKSCVSLQPDEFQGQSN